MGNHILLGAVSSSIKTGALPDIARISITMYYVLVHLEIRGITGRIPLSKLK